MQEPDGTLRVDVLKLPHHGATGNNHAALFERVKATHYVISADGNFGNPDPSVLELLVKSEKARSITIWLTNGPGENGRYAKVLDDRFARLTALIAKHDAKRVKVRYPSSRDRSVIVTISR